MLIFFKLNLIFYYALFFKITLKSGEKIVPLYIINDKTMSRSKKKQAGGTFAACKSQKKGKQLASRRFRHRARTEMASGREERVPFKSIELTPTYDLGGDGKGLYNTRGASEEDMRRFLAK